MGTIWFCLVTAILVGYVVLDGFDIGAGALHLWLARNDPERSAVINSIGPVWGANEVWLVAAGGTLYFAFPALYAASFSGFYLPLMMVLWLLIVRGISIEFRSHVETHIWSLFFDATFSLASALLAVFFGAALGNVVRGVPFDAAGRFFEPLWTNFAPAGQTGILDWYTVLVGVAALAALTLHGATWVAYKTEGEVSERAFRAASWFWWLVVALTLAITYATFRLHPWLLSNFRHVWGFSFPILAVGGLLGVKWFERKRQDAAAFVASCVYLIGMLTSAAFSLYPSVLPSGSAFPGLTVENARAADSGLRIGLAWWPLGMALAVAYTINAYRTFAGKVPTAPSRDHEGY